MRCAAFALLLATGFAGAPLSGAHAQGIVDLSKPQTGKSRFVLNSDMTPADLGARQAAKPAPVAVVSRAPACGEGCKMEQPDVPRETRNPRRGYAYVPGFHGSDERTRAFIVVNAKSIHDATQKAEQHKRTYRFRRR
jgi:hypothetical protein